MTFPQYRKYSNEQSYFKINSPVQLEEIKVLGKHYQSYLLNAKQLPDRNFITDLLKASGGGILIITETTFNWETAELLKTKELLV